jgi:ice-binding like protein
MKTCKGYSKMWFLVVLLVACVAGCGGNDTVALNSAKAITAYSLNGATGTVNESAKTIAMTMPFGTNVTALIATFTTTGASVNVGTTLQTSGTTANNFTNPVAYTVTAADGTTAIYTVIVTVADATAKAITSYSLAGVAGAINEAAKTIAVTVPSGTNLTNLIATFTTTGGSVKVGAALQASGTTPNSFTSPVAYTVTAGDGTTATYTVTVTVADATAKAITVYSLNGAAGTINETAKTIAVTMPNGTNVTALVATFTTTGGSVKVGATVQTSGTTANDFTSPVAYTVTAGDGTTATYTVTVTVPLSAAKAITAYSLNGAAGTIDKTAKTIAVTMPNGTSVTALIATFTTTGASVKVGAGATVQVSGTTPNNFTSPVAYTVTAADGTTAIYTVTVTVADVTAKAITVFSLKGVAGTINETAKTIAVTVPNGTILTNLVATFTTTGASVMVGAAVQTSGTTLNNFTGPVDYTVTAADASTAIYTVTVIVATAKGPAPVNLGTAGNFVILAKSGVSTTGTTAVVGDIGLSPAAATFITGFGLIADSTNTFSTSSLVTGRLYAADYTPPTPDNMTTAVGDMETAFTDAAGRTLPDFTELGAGNISGLTLVPGLYKWGTGVLITGVGVTLSGGANDVWIFQIAQDLTVNNSAIVILSGGAQAKNIFWQVSGQATLGTAADFKGIILSQTLISLNTGAKMNGRALAQTAVTLDANAVTAP